MIKEIKISLMETAVEPNIEEDIAAGEYIIRSSAKFKPLEYWEKNYRDSTPLEKDNEDLFQNFLSSSLDLIFHELTDQTKQPVDSVGIWIDTGKEHLEIAMTLEGLENIAQYGDKDIVPIYELLQMAVLKNS